MERADHQEDVEEEVQTIEEQLRALAIARLVLEQNCLSPGELSQALYNYQRGLRLKKLSHMTQTTILDHFGTK